MNSHLEKILRQEHQSKALLVKFAWLMISETCLVLISRARWIEQVRLAYIFANAGVGFLLAAAIGLMISANRWPKDRSVIIRTWLAIDAIVWLLASASLFSGACLWWFYGYRIAAMTSGLVSLLPLLTAFFCWKASKRWSSPQSASPDSLQYVRRRTGIIASIAVGYCFVAVIDGLASTNAGSAGRLLLGLLGFAAAMITIKVGTELVFEDRLRVFSSRTGTQYVYPTQIVLDEQLFAELQMLTSELQETVGRRGRKR